MSGRHTMTLGTNGISEPATGTKASVSSRSKVSSSKRSRTSHSQMESTRPSKQPARNSQIGGDSSTSIGTLQSNSPALYETPPVPWVQGDRGNRNNPDEKVVKAYVGMHLFRELKFISKDEIELVYNTTEETSACFNVLTGCKCAINNIDRENWWTTKASVWVYDTIIHLRNSKVDSLKNVFWSKWFFVPPTNFCSSSNIFSGVIADLEANNKTVPKLQEYLQGRKLTSVYMIVYDKFIPCIASSKFYKESVRERLLDKNNNSELFTQSDEAFTLLVLENYFHRWMDIYKKEDGIPRRRVGSRKKKQPDSEVKPKYTSGGLVYKNSKDVKGKGWQDDGILRYNDLFGFVEEDRKNNELFMSRYLESKREKEGEFIARRARSIPRPSVRARCDLGLNLGMSKVVVTPVERVATKAFASGAASESDEDDGDGSGTDDEYQMKD